MKQKSQVFIKICIIFIQLFIYSHNSSCISDVKQVQFPAKCNIQYNNCSTFDDDIQQQIYQITFSKCFRIYKSENVSLNYNDCMSQCCQISDIYRSIIQTCLKYEDSNPPFWLLVLIIPGIIIIVIIVNACCRFYFKIKKDQQNINDDKNLQSMVNICKKQQQDLDQIVFQKCSICLQNQTNIQTNCKHYFHYNCIILWFKKNYKCPNCINGKFVPLRAFCKFCKRNCIQIKIQHHIKWNNLQNSIRNLSCQNCLNPLKLLQ